MPATERPAVSLLRASAVALAVLVVAEFAAGALRPRIPSAIESGDGRNPHYARGWPEYTRPAPDPPPGTEPLVIVITNSQGYLREREDPAEAWPSLLGAELARSGAPVRVLNWAAPGSNGVEMTLLAARARAHDPALVVLVSYNNNFARFWRDRALSFGYTDVQHLAYLPEVRKLLPGALLSASEARDPLAWLGAHTSLLWLRNYWSDYQERWSFRVVEPRLASGPRAGEVHPIGKVDQFTLLDDFLHAAGAGTPGGPALLIVGMPLCAEACTHWEFAGAFSAYAARRAESLARTRVLDASALVPSEEFYGARHMRPAGHARFAAWLAPHARALLAEAE